MAFHGYLKGCCAASVLALVSCGAGSDVACISVAGALDGCSPAAEATPTPTPVTPVTGTDTVDGAVPPPADEATVSSGAVLDEIQYVELTAGNADDVIIVTGAGFDGFGQYVRDIPDLGDARTDNDIDRNTGEFLAFQNARGQRDYKLVYSQTTSGEMRAFAVATDDYDETGDYLASFERDIDRAPPARGFADYTGSYSGYIIGINNTEMAEIRGRALVEFDFEQEYVEGRISGRQIIYGNLAGRYQMDGVNVLDNEGNFVRFDPVTYTGPADPFRPGDPVSNPDVVRVQYVQAGAGQDVNNVDPLNDIVFGRAELQADGTFSGEATISRDGERGATGFWQGTLGGVDGAVFPSEVVGLVDLDGDKIDGRDEARTKEIGVFSASCNPDRDGTLCTTAPLPDPLPVN